MSRSGPAPPSSRSRPGPPSTRSAPASPRMRSAPAPPTPVSLPAPRQMRSSPPRPLTTSLPPRAAITSRLAVPRMTLRLSVPTMVAGRRRSGRRARRPRRRRGLGRRPPAPPGPWCGRSAGGPGHGRGRRQRAHEDVSDRVDVVSREVVALRLEGHPAPVRGDHRVQRASVTGRAGGARRSAHQRRGAGHEVAHEDVADRVVVLAREVVALGVEGREPAVGGEVAGPRVAIGARARGPIGAADQRRGVGDEVADVGVVDGVVVVARQVVPGGGEHDVPPVGHSEAWLEKPPSATAPAVPAGPAGEDGQVPCPIPHVDVRHAVGVVLREVARVREERHEAPVGGDRGAVRGGVASRAARHRRRG